MSTDQIRHRNTGNGGRSNGAVSSPAATSNNKPPPSSSLSSSSIGGGSGKKTDHDQILMENLSPDNPVHISQDSLLSSSSGYTNYRGLFNLAVILLFLSNARVALENLIKYGILSDFGYWYGYMLTDAHKSPVGILLGLVNVHILTALGIEKALYSGRIATNRRGAMFHSINLAAVLLVPVVVILLKEPNPLGGAACLMMYSITFLKLISYAHVNYWCRSSRGKRSKPTAAATRGKNGAAATQSDDQLLKSSTSPTSASPQQQPRADNIRFMSRPRSFSSGFNQLAYPHNLTVRNVYYFMLAPTLCYELNFPRSPKVRKWFVVKRLVESIFLMQVIIALCQQWIVPLLRNSLEPFIALNNYRMLERLLKLAIPNHIIWLIFFYWQFHSIMNLTAELLRFADREFYRDWWNAETIDYFWRNWNVPVHRWCVRHLYKPLVGAGYGRLTASTVVFLLSAFFHEYLISVPLHLFRLWAFAGMFAQVPLNFVTSRWAKGRAGNVVVWLSLIVGQPLCILMYVHDWYVTHHAPLNHPNATTIGGS